MRRILALTTCAFALWHSHAHAQTGSGISIPLGGGGLSITAEQGFSRGLASNSAMATVPNGVPGFVFGGTMSPFVTGVFPVVAGGPGGYRAAGMSQIQKILSRGDVQFLKDESGNTRVVAGDPLNSTAGQSSKRAAQAGSVATSTPNSKDAFRRGLEKYAGSKR
jgi:hypothetical protein